MRFSKYGVTGVGAPTLFQWRAGPCQGRGAGTRRRAEGYALLCENSFSTGTPTLCRAREAQSRWKNSST